MRVTSFIAILTWLACVSPLMGNLSSQSLDASPRPWKTGNPLIVVTGPTSKLNANRQAWENLIGTDDLIDCNAHILFLDDKNEPNSNRPKPGAWLRSSMNLPSSEMAPDLWVLLGPDGRHLTHGTSMPSQAALLDAIEKGCGESLVKRLRQFLRRYPEHAEARRDLIQALRPRLDQKLRGHIFSPGADLPQNMDRLIWGDMAEALGAYLSDSDWVSIGSSLLELLPQAVLERNSPLMRSMYFKHRPAVLDILRQYPESPTAWLTLVRMDEVLQDGVLMETLASQPLSFYKDGNLGPFPYWVIGRRVTARAQQSGDWDTAAPLLRLLWEKGARPHLATLCSGGGAFQGTAMEARLREWAWEGNLAPLLEGLVRTKAESETDPILGGLDSGWLSFGIGDKLGALARRISRPELGARWASQLPNMPGKYLPGGMGLIGFGIFFHHQSGKIDLGAYHRCINQQGIQVGMTQIAPSQAVAMGWSLDQPHWILAGPDGRVFLQGDHLPAPEMLRTSYLEAGIPTTLGILQAFLKDHPGNIAAEANVASVYRSQVMSYAESGLGKTRLSEGEKSARRAYFKSFEQLLSNPLGTSTPVLQMIRPWSRIVVKSGRSDSQPDKPYESIPDDMDLADLARRCLPLVESALRRRPSDPILWETWMTLAPLADGNIFELVRTIEPSPALPPESWPSPMVLDDMAEKLRSEKRWPQILELLEPQWKAEQGRRSDPNRKSEPRSPYTKPNWTLWSAPRFYIEACLHLGRTAEAESCMDYLSNSGQPIPYLGWLCEMAKQLGYEHLATRWSTRSKAKN